MIMIILAQTVYRVEYVNITIFASCAAVILVCIVDRHCQLCSTISAVFGQVQRTSHAR